MALISNLAHFLIIVISLNTRCSKLKKTIINSYFLLKFLLKFAFINIAVMSRSLFVLAGVSPLFFVWL